MHDLMASTENGGITFVCQLQTQFSGLTSDNGTPVQTYVIKKGTINVYTDLYL